MRESIQNKNLAYSLLILSFLLQIILIYFFKMGYFNVMIPLKGIYAIPFFFYFCAMLGRAHRYFFLTRGFEKHFTTPLTLVFFSESFGNFLFPFFKDVYGAIVALITFKEKIKAIKVLFWVRLIDIIFIIFAFLIFQIQEVFSGTFFMEWLYIFLSLFIILNLIFFYIFKDSFFQKHLNKNIIYTFIQTLFIWLLEALSLGLFLNLSKGTYSFKEVVIDIALKFSPVEGLHYKWFYFIAALSVSLIFFLEGVRLLSRKGK